MPELPEVEYVTRQLRSELIGRRISRAIIYWPGSVSGIDPAAFGAAITGHKITEITRRGKYLLIRLDVDQWLIIHRGMSGNLLIDDSPDETLYVRVAFLLDDGRYLLFSDPRKFGRLRLDSANELAERFDRLGPEPLDDGFTPDMLAARLKGTRRAIKVALMDQKVIAGLGNIYADEALFDARIHPTRISGELSPSEIQTLSMSISSVLRSAIEHGGTTFGRHRDVYNRAGTNLDHVLVYRRTNRPCPRCGTPIERIVLGQRSTHFCPVCQRMPE
jgi:formamidopyrimidine-DNA glycosylase